MGAGQLAVAGSVSPTPRREAAESRRDYGCLCKFLERPDRERWRDLIASWEEMKGDLFTNQTPPAITINRREENGKRKRNQETSLCSRIRSIQRFYFPLYPVSP